MSYRKELNIEKFNMKSIAPDSLCVFIGKRNGGKTFLVKDLLFHKKDIPLGTVISQTETLNGNFSENIPGTFIHTKFNSSILQDVFDQQEKKILEKRKMYPGLAMKDVIKILKQDISNYVFVVLDDCLSDSKNWKNDPVVQRIFYEGRHYFIFFLLTMQVPLGIPPNLRGNLDYVFITFTNNKKDRKTIFDNYSGIFENFQEFSTILDECTMDYNCLVIDNNSRSNKLQDQVFYYKAIDHGNYKMCDDKAWAYHNYITAIKKKPKSTSSHQIKNKVITINKFN